jgi:hypothetical protein
VCSVTHDSETKVTKLNMTLFVNQHIQLTETVRRVDDGGESGPDILHVAVYNFLRVKIFESLGRLTQLRSQC